MADKKLIRNRYLLDPEETFKFNAWDDVEWSEDQEIAASEKITANSIITIGNEQILMYDQQADKFWNKFYEQHQEKFFKNRNWLFSEFPELQFSNSNISTNLFEIGCGVGNTTIPILQQNINNSHFMIYCCDFSNKAIELLKKHKTYNTTKCTAFTFDISQTPWPNDQLPFSELDLNIVTMIFVLSAINPQKLPMILREIYRFMKSDGIILFRDYGRYDMAQLRLKSGQCIGDNFYVRGDGTQVHFFTKTELQKLFSNAGFESIGDILVDRRLQVNRIKNLTMYRVWIQAKFRKIDDYSFVARK